VQLSAIQQTRTGSVTVTMKSWNGNNASHTSMRQLSLQQSCIIIAIA